MMAVPFMEPAMHYVSTCETSYVSNAMAMETHKHVHISHNMPTIKVEWPEKILTIDKANYG